MEVKRQGENVQSTKEKKTETRGPYPAKLPLKNEGIIKIFPDKHRQFVLSRPALQETKLKKFFRLHQPNPESYSNTHKETKEHQQG